MVYFLICHVVLSYLVVSFIILRDIFIYDFDREEILVSFIIVLLSPATIFNMLLMEYDFIKWKRDIRNKIKRIKQAQ